MDRADKAMERAEKAFIQIARKKQGFATLSPERQREIARLGGIAAQKSGNAHRWNSEKAKEAGRKGGSKPKRKLEGMEG